MVRARVTQAPECIVPAIPLSALFQQYRSESRPHTVSDGIIAAIPLFYHFIRPLSLEYRAASVIPCLLTFTNQNILLTSTPIDVSLNTVSSVTCEEKPIQYIYI